MENKYFTPSIEDIRVGYEFQLEAPSGWLSDQVICQANIADVTKMLLRGADIVRVPFLTKEQIEAEGWKYSNETYLINSDDTYFEKNGGYCELWTNRAGINSGLTVYWGNNFHEDCIFFGECKDVNTFRMICKLLKIN